MINEWNTQGRSPHWRAGQLETYSRVYGEWINQRIGLTIRPNETAQEAIDREGIRPVVGHAKVKCRVRFMDS